MHIQSVQHSRSHVRVCIVYNVVEHQVVRPSACITHGFQVRNMVRPDYVSRLRSRKQIQALHR